MAEKRLRIYTIPSGGVFRRNVTFLQRTFNYVCEKVIL